MSDVQLPAEIRKVIRTLDDRGILQSVSSKNDYDQAWERLEQLGVAEYFVHQASFRRDAERESFHGPDEEFLRSLELVMTIKRADEEDLSRVEELTLRTSQMNATGVHYPDAVLRGLLTDPGPEVLTVSLSDRFGPHGAVGVLPLAYHPGVWHLKLLATSCRVHRRVLLVHDRARVGGRRRQYPVPAPGHGPPRGAHHHAPHHPGPGRPAHPRGVGSAALIRISSP